MLSNILSRSAQDSVLNSGRRSVKCCSRWRWDGNPALCGKPPEPDGSVGSDAIFRLLSFQNRKSVCEGEREGGGGREGFG